ncbi:hypothetical protein [Streptomyces palmae]|uniref:Uncharacterized protein n=1 Tax=Streptomyces palmae TaxID=1701085 RepID=A0A4Z0HB70_9ACTN|nr:hypothetical protein [Streptomyces palmae]TGB08840.1 hypothetical protein E4099_14640 [Streptomyces palmae]
MRRIAAAALGAAAVIGALAAPALADNPFGFALDDLTPANITTTADRPTILPADTAERSIVRTTTKEESPWIKRLGLDDLAP